MNKAVNKVVSQALSHGSTVFKSTYAILALYSVV